MENANADANANANANAHDDDLISVLLKRISDDNPMPVVHHDAVSNTPDVPLDVPLDVPPDVPDIQTGTQFNRPMFCVR